MIYSKVEMEQVIGWIPFVALAKKWPTDGSHLYNALVLLACIQTILGTPHAVVINSAIVLAAFQHVHHPVAGNRA